MSALPRLVVVLGPTASGKSMLGIRLAESLAGEILVCDSTQVYRHFDIGTAKVPPAEQRGIAHHLVDLCEPAEVFTAGDYRHRALEALDDLRARKIPPILTAGTGLYLRALLEGLADAPQRSEEIRARLRQRVEQRGPEHLHRVLEDHRTAVRNIRRDGNDLIKKAAKDKKISEDEEKRSLEEIQKLTDEEIKKMEEMAKKKEVEVMQV